VPRDPSSDFVLFHAGASAILVNPSPRAANVTVTDFAGGPMQSLTIPGHGRFAISLTGPVRVRSSEGLAAVERRTPGTTTVITSNVAVSDAQSSLVFPQAVTGGGYTSTLSLVNVGTGPMNGTVTF